jgi:hypothetical protein
MTKDDSEVSEGVVNVVNGLQVNYACNYALLPRLYQPPRPPLRPPRGRSVSGASGSGAWFERVDGAVGTTAVTKHSYMHS